MNNGSGGACASIIISSPNSKLCVKCDPSMNILPFWEFQRRCIFLSSLKSWLSTSLPICSFEFSFICSRIKYCKSVELISILCPPAAAMAAVDPVLVQTHIPEDQTLILSTTSYACPANRVAVPNSRDFFASSSSIGFNQPIRNRETAAGLGLAIRRSFNAGTNRVSEKVDFTLHRIRDLYPNWLSASPCKIVANFSFISWEVHMQSAPCDRRSSTFFFVTRRSSLEMLGSELIPSKGIVPWSKKCAALSTVPSPPTATIKSISAKCCRSNSTRLTHPKLTWFFRKRPSRSLTHCLWDLYRCSNRFHLSAFGAWPLNFNC